MDRITVREATPEDVEDVLAIAERGWDRAYSEFLSRETIETAMAEWYDPDDTQEYIEREDVAYFVTENSGEVIGYLSGGPSDEENVARLGAV
jgi:L-amino acid N-acyltransferase YncA